MKAILILIVLSSFGVGQSSDNALRESADAHMAPRSLLLTGGDLDSPSGKYVIEFPSPNDCVILGPIKAKSRSLALYRAVSQGGFSLKPSEGGLTVWTIEEWNGLKKEPWYAQFEQARAKRCGPSEGK